MTQRSIDELARKLKLRMAPEMLERAFLHSSYTNEVGDPRGSNERLEFLGDAVLGFLIAEALWRRFPEATEGDLSRLRAQLVNRESLARVAQQLELGRYLRLGAGELRSGGHARESILADAVEAVLAALYLDGGLDVVRRVVDQLLGERLAGLSPETQRKDAKTRLQEYLQARRVALPTYEVIDTAGEDHAQTFVVRCAVDALGRATTAAGPSRRKAEQLAAERLLETLDHE
jgi:ribonuclease-3